jgi:hypothetical protein
MNKTKRTGVLFALLLLCVLHIANGQGISKKRDYSGFFDSYYYRGPLSITAGIGTSIFKGDISKGFYGSPGLAFSLGANYKLWPRTVFGAEFQYLSLAGKTGDSTALSFTGTDWGVNLYGRLYFIDDIIRKAQDRRTNKKTKAYITTGIGFIKYKATSTIGANSAMTPVFPLGLGLEFKISPKLQIIPEFTHTFTFNDRLDAAPIKKGKDGYSMLMLKVQYSPFAPKRKKKITTAPADPNQHREEHQEWRKKKVEEPKPVEEMPEENSEEEPKEEGTEEQPTDEQPKDENTEEKPNGE